MDPILQQKSIAGLSFEFLGLPAKIVKRKKITPKKTENFIIWPSKPAGQRYVSSVYPSSASPNEVIFEYRKTFYRLEIDTLRVEKDG